MLCYEWIILQEEECISECCVVLYCTTGGHLWGNTTENKVKEGIIACKEGHIKYWIIAWGHGGILAWAM